MWITLRFLLPTSGEAIVLDFVQPYATRSLGPSGLFGGAGWDSRVNRLRGPRYNPPRSRHFSYERRSRAFAPKQYLNLTGTIARLYLVRNVAAYPPGTGSSRHASQPKPIMHSGSQWLHETSTTASASLPRKNGERVSLYNFIPKLSWVATMDTAAPSGLDYSAPGIPKSRRCRCC